MIGLAKSTIYKTFSAALNSAHHATNYKRMFQLRLQFRLQLEMHHSIWENDMETFQNYWLHNILGKISNGIIVLNDNLLEHQNVYKHLSFVVF
jgi:hypothetical protein